MTEVELARDLNAVLEKVRKGTEVVIERDHRGHAVTLDTDFAAGVEEIVRNRQPWNPPSWD